MTKKPKLELITIDLAEATRIIAQYMIDKGRVRQKPVYGGMATLAMNDEKVFLTVEVE